MKQRTRRRRHYAQPLLTNHMSLWRFEQHFDLAMKQVAGGRVFFITRPDKPTVALVSARLHDALQAISEERDTEDDRNEAMAALQQNPHMMSDDIRNAVRDLREQSFEADLRAE